MAAMKRKGQLPPEIPQEGELPPLPPLQESPIDDPTLPTGTTEKLTGSTGTDKAPASKRLTKDEKREELIATGIAKIYGTAGTMLMMVGGTQQSFADGNLLMQAAGDFGRCWVEVAKLHRAKRKGDFDMLDFLEKIAAGEAHTNLAVIHISVLFAIAKNHGVDLMAPFQRLNRKRVQEPPTPMAPPPSPVAATQSFTYAAPVGMPNNAEDFPQQSYGTVEPPDIYNETLRMRRE
jgi:hypothetical protein